MTPEQQAALNELFERVFNKKLSEGENITLAQVEMFFGKYFKFEQTVLPEKKWIDILDAFKDPGEEKVFLE